MRIGIQPNPVHHPIALRVVLSTALLCAGVCFAGPYGFLHLNSNNAQPSAQSQSEPQSQAATPAKQEKKDSDSATVKLRIHVTGGDKPIGNAAVYIRYNVSGGLLHHDKLSELDFKTNEDGSVKVPEVPRGKILIQVVAKGWHTYGEWHDIKTSQETIEIKLAEPTHWY